MSENPNCSLDGERDSSNKQNTNQTILGQGTKKKNSQMRTKLQVGRVRQEAGYQVRQVQTRDNATNDILVTEPT